MNLKQLFTDDDAVSPVIGVILMVAITVILAAVIGTFVLGLGDQVGNNAPQASFSFDFSDSSSGGSDTLEIVHNGGASVTATQMDIKASPGAIAPSAGDSATSSIDYSTLSGASTEVSAGDSVTIGAASGEQLNDVTVRLIWTAESGDSSAELGTWTGPDA